MARWQVEITGDSSDLEDLPALFTAPGFRVVVDEGRYYLEATEFEALTQSMAVHDAAKALLPRINGVAKLKHPSFRDVDVGPIREHGGEGEPRLHVVLQPASSILRSKVSAVTIKLGEDPPEPPAPGSLDSDEWMRATSSHAYASRALALWGGRHDPMNLWKVWELVRDHSGLTINPDRRRRFRPALNDRAVSGEDARHEVPSRLPVEPDTMTLQEAEDFLSGLLTQWLNSLRGPTT